MELTIHHTFVNYIDALEFEKQIKQKHPDINVKLSLLNDEPLSKKQIQMAFTNKAATRQIFKKFDNKKRKSDLIDLVKNHGINHKNTVNFLTKQQTMFDILLFTANKNKSVTNSHEIKKLTWESFISKKRKKPKTKAKTKTIKKKKISPFVKHFTPNSTDERTVTIHYTFSNHAEALTQKDRLLTEYPYISVHLSLLSHEALTQQQLKSAFTPQSLKYVFDHPAKKAERKKILNLSRTHGANSDKTLSYLEENQGLFDSLLFSENQFNTMSNFYDLERSKWESFIPSRYISYYKTSSDSSRKLHALLNESCKAHVRKININKNGVPRKHLELLLATALVPDDEDPLSALLTTRTPSGKEFYELANELPFNEFYEKLCENPKFFSSPFLLDLKRELSCIGYDEEESLAVIAKSDRIQSIERTI
ncbi:hypothetical protein bcgnr5378_37030 [Bacillus cereus]|uniref:Uncharacterized protein n=1 Tax=Bacillus cereus TaxID=1396 RepID=A0A164QNU8_BACCE|nr:hypothetical protein [Bacillus cereus]KZD71966.1 hypothetical protein B4088_0427 [Bacillus cereus]HDR8322084.1 hypothetical protein [Bacillus cereus]HDR8328634.1 hypothetical protein [Bacillus cereus]HDR8334270.1 hypothetical protein [Bacillus cereus]